MGRGGYNGGSTIIGPGSSLFGYGKRRSVKTTSDETTGQVVIRAKKAGKPRPNRLPSDGIGSAAEAQSRGLTRAEWLSKADRRVSRVEALVDVARTRLCKLEAQLDAALIDRDKARKAPPLSSTQPGPAKPNLPSGPR